MHPRLPRSTPPRSLSHVERDARGEHAHMVDVGDKEPSSRSATARARVRFPAGVRERLLAGQGPKGPIEEMARAAGVLAAKRVGELVPLCHPLALEHVTIDFAKSGRDALEIRCRAACHARTGVEMEALVGAALAALTVYDMSKALDKGIVIERLELLEKRGGRSGAWSAGGARRSRASALRRTS
jgi:cyclic pyranopterin phosphate synthase